MSLRIRLVLLVSALVTLLLLGFGSYLGRSMGVWSSEVLDRELRHRVEELEAHLEVEHGRLELEDEEGTQDSGPFRVQDAAGATLLEGGLDKLGFRTRSDLLGYETMRTPGGKPWRLYSARISAHHDRQLSPERRPLVLTVAAPAERFSALSTRFRVGLGTAVLLGIMLGALGAAAVAQVVSGPLRRLSGQVELIDEKSLDRRVDLRGLDPELARLARALNAAFDRLEIAFEQQRNFVGRASHALRTPIASILSVAEVAGRRERSSEENRAALRDIVRVADGASQLIDQLLSLARVDASRGVLSEEMFEVNSVGDDLRALFAPRVEQAGLHLELDVPAGLRIRADRSSFLELLDALLDNAVRYTPKGGRVGLTAQAADGHVEIEVWDTGLGIRPEEREEVFERFRRGVAAEESGQPGSGLGLAIAKAIAIAHGADLRIEARGDGGTRVISRWAARGV
ncbi:MAG: HAMP domain-containing protein [Deltaproteobacteria bacterium]|nr:HAMP domain-containing protein [Deltaproteobacteria bacterium]